MKLPIHLNIEADTIWIIYKSELEKVQTPDELKVFVARWKEIYSCEIKDITQETLDSVKAEKSDNMIAEIVVPVKILKAMMVSKEYVVPLNCAFIQGNGGLGEFEE